MRVNDKVICHNCFTIWPKGEINMCNGLCRRCIRQNPVQIKDINRSSSGEGKGLQCKKCLRDLKHSNIGICRNTCNFCAVDHHPLKQRCMSCDIYSLDCWNNLCRLCRDNKGLCHNTGYFFRNGTQHNEHCWCVHHGYALHRQKIQKTSMPSSTTGAASRATSAGTSTHWTSSGVVEGHRNSLYRFRTQTLIKIIFRIFISNIIVIYIQQTFCII